VSFSLNNFYARWRRHSGAVPTLREGADPPPEQLLQSIWQQQRLRRDQLTTFDGQPVRILHPGFLSREGGPDFRAAVIQFGNHPPVSGDVELDIVAGGWKAHGHDRNPKFKSVVLHAVWQAPTRPAAGPPLVALHGKLDAPLAELAEWLGGEGVPGLPEEFRGRCAAPLCELGDDALQQLLQQAALVRLRGKASQFAARAREAGWEQSLWEGLFRALGYKHNPWPMQRLAELRPRWQSKSADAVSLQSRLLGIANLLPTELTRAQIEADAHLRQLWDGWWRERDAYEDCVLPRSLWRLHGIRPVNHPQRRLALAAHWLADGKLVTSLERWATAPCDDRRKRTSRRQVSELAAVLQPAPDEFWSRHLTLRSRRSAKPQLLLGDARVTDLAMNAVLPWLWARAAEGNEASLTDNLQTAYLMWPAGEDNSVLKLARQRLLGAASEKDFNTASAQQGLLQIVRDFCDRSNAICNHCRFPELVKAWGMEPHSASPQR